MILVRFLLFFMLFQPLLSSQNYWKPVEKSEIPSLVTITQTTIPDKAQTLQLSFESFSAYLRKAPLEFSGKEGLKVDLPMPDGSMETFLCYFSPVMEEPSQHDEYRVYTYKAKSVEHPEWSVRMDYSPWGFHASVNTSKGQVFIHPLTDREGAYYTSYYIDDLAHELPELFQYICEVDSSMIDFHSKADESIDFRDGDWPLMTYRVAISCTGEWGRNSSLGGGTVELAMAKITSAVSFAV